jgi:hypothetical protein
VKREFYFDLYTLASSKPQVTGDVSPGPNLPKEKEPPHCGDIGWGRFLLRQLGLYLLAFDLATNCAITGTPLHKEKFD